MKIAEYYRHELTKCGFSPSYKAFDYSLYILKNYSYERFLGMSAYNLVDELAEKFGVCKQSILKNCATFINAAYEKVGIFSNNVFARVDYCPSFKQYVVFLLLSKKEWQNSAYKSGLITYDELDDDVVLINISE